MGRAVSRGYATRCLADDLKQLQKGQGQHTLPIEIGTTLPLD